MTSDCHFTLQVLDARSVMPADALLAEWKEFAQAHPHVYAQYASPTWVTHLVATGDAPVRVWFARDRSRYLVGAGPLVLRDYVLQFAVCNMVLLRKRLRAVEIMGSVLTLPQSPQIHRDVIATVFSDWPECDCIYLHSVPTDTYFWRFLCDGTGLPRTCYLHVIDGPRPWHLVQLASSFEDYLTSLAPKSRSTLRRKARQLAQAMDADLELCRITDATEVSRFLQLAARVDRSSWQHRTFGKRIRDDVATRKAFEDLANRGILRSYVLRAGDTPSAFVVGYQFRGVYHYADLGFDEGYAKYSPGTVLLILMLEDLHRHQRPETLNFGIGDSTYKRRFANCERSDASCLIMRRSLGNVLLTQSHTLFKRATTVAKKLVGRNVQK